MNILQRVLKGIGRRALWASGTHPRDPAFAEWWGGGAETSAGMSVTADSALQSTAVYACTKLLANAVASLPVPMYRWVDGDGRERDQSHPLVLVLKKPNRWQTRFQFRQMMHTNLLLRGNGYAEIISSGGSVVSELIPLHPDRTRPFRAPDGSIAFEHWPRSGPRRVLLQGEVFHLADLTLDDEGIEGKGAIQLHRESIGLEQAARNYGSRFFSNNAQPGGAIKVPSVLTDKAADSLIKTWEQRHQGKPHRLRILDGGMEWVQTGMTNEDAQFLETRRYQVSDIARIFGVPPHMIGETDKSTSWGTGIEQQSLGFITFSLTPWLCIWEQSIMRDLMTEESRETHFVEFNVDGLKRGDFASRMSGHATAIQWGFDTVNGVRRIENKPPLPGGDNRLMPSNFVQIDDKGNVIPMPRPEQKEVFANG